MTASEPRGVAAQSQTEERYRALFGAIDEGFCVVEVLFEPSGEIADLLVREVNQVFERQTGLSDVIGRSLRELLPGLEPYWLEICARVARTGERVRTERYLRDLGRWYRIFLSRVGGPGSGLIAVVFDDVSERRRVEERLTFQAHLLANTSEALTAVDESDVITYWNAAAEQLFGWLSAEVIGRASSDVFQRPLLHAPGDVEPASVVALGGYEAEGSYRHKHGHILACDARTRVLYGVDGEFRGVVAAFRDVTQRKHVEKTLRESEERQAYMLRLSDALRPLADAAAIQREASRILREQLQADCISYFEVDEEGGLAVAENGRPGGPVFLGARVTFEQFGVFRDEFLAGKVCCRGDVAADPQLSAAEKASYVTANVNAWACAPLVKEGVLTATLVAYFVSRHEWKDDELSLLQETAERTWAAVERARATVALRESELHARRLLLEATDARKQAEAANLAKDEFLATLSHELRTPLAAVLLWAGMLRSGAMPLHEWARAVDAILQSAQSQSRLIEDLLDLSRLTSGKLALSQTAVSFEALVRGAIDVVRPAAEAKGIALALELGQPIGTLVLDGARVQQVLWNMLTNAIKFTPPGGAVTLRVGQRLGALELEVSDTGEGIAPEFLPHIFEKFRQADMGEAREHMGLGIGLALSKQLVELHGGTIEAASRGRGLGAVFRVRLPWITVHEAQLRDPASDAADRPRLPLEALSVLLVEDDLHTREAMRVALVAAGARVVPVATGVEALGALGLQDAAGVLRGAERLVIVSDLGLPGMSGFELIRRVVDACRRSDHPPPPACAISAHARDTDRKRAIDAGFDLYLAKPIAPEQLVQAVVDLREVLAAAPS